jgi:hypothetical protein
MISIFFCDPITFLILFNINVGGFAISICGANSRGIAESEERQPPLQALNRRSKLRGIHKEKKLSKEGTSSQLAEKIVKLKDE